MIEKKIKMSKRGEPWTTDEHDRMLDALRGGMSFEKVARQHERSVKAIQWRFGTHCQRVMPKKTIEQVAQEFRQSPDRIEEIMVDMKSQKQQQHQLQSHSQPVIAAADTTHIDEILQKHTKLLKKIFQNQQNILSEIEKLKKNKIS